jgi:diadenosine tetraphosphate (Ap4A) HIT family hydrolase
MGLSRRASVDGPQSTGLSRRASVDGPHAIGLIQTDPQPHGASGAPMPSPFELDPRLSADSLPVMTLGLSEVRLHRDARYPWLLVIPQVPGAREILDLAGADQDRLWAEVRWAAQVLTELHRPTKLNIAALGNQVPQLHVHVIARFEGDAAWPAPVWGAHPPLPYAAAEASDALDALRSAFRRVGAAGGWGA